MSNSSDYHDYVFKDGKRIGKFDEMYKYSAEIPWHQDKTAYSVFSDIDISILKQFKYESICEVGCGLGYFSNRLYKELSSNAGLPKVTGIEISKTAVEKASEQFPDIRFIVGDLTKEILLPDEKYDLVVIKEVFWYVCHSLKQFLKNIREMIKENGFLFVSQSFPGTEKWVGDDLIVLPSLRSGRMRS